MRRNKRIIAIVLCIAALLSLASCKKKDDAKPTEGEVIATNPIEPTKPIEQTDPPYRIEYNDGIRENGKLPTQSNKLTNDEFYHYLSNAIRAVLNMDIDTVREYDKTGDFVKAMEAISANNEHKTMYEQTIGDVLYLPDSHSFVYRDPLYIYARWMTKELDGDKKLPKSVDNLSKDEATGIYKKYYKDMVYTIAPISRTDIKFELVGGRIYFDMNSLLNLIGYDDINKLVPSANKNFARYVFGTSGKTIDTNAINKSTGPKDIWKVLVSKDLGKMVKYVDGNKNYDMNEGFKESTLDDCYRLYYKNSSLRSKIQKWMNENVEVYRSDDQVVTYIKANINDEYNLLYRGMSKNEKEMLTDLEICQEVRTFENGSADEWYVYFQIVEQMISDGKLKDLYS